MMSCARIVHKFSAASAKRCDATITLYNARRAAVAYANTIDTTDCASNVGFKCNDVFLCEFATDQTSTHLQNKNDRNRNLGQKKCHAKFVSDAKSLGEEWTIEFNSKLR